MHTLKGSGSTFSTSGQRWNPFRGNRKVAAQNAKRHRIVRAGHGGTMSKAELRSLADQAAATHTITRIATGRRTTSRTED